MNHSETAHQWANEGKKQSSANSNIKYWDFGTIYSYGSHFILAKRVEFEGKEYVFLNTNDYSNSTSKHKNHVRQATKHLNCISLPFLKNNQFEINQLPEIIERLKIDVKNFLFDQIKAKSNFWYYDSACTTFAQINRLAITFNLPCIYTTDFLQWEQAKEKAEYLRDTKDQREQAKKEKLASLEKENLSKWLNNEYNGQLYNLPVYLRFNSDKSQIQTSHGAIVPTKEAFILLDKLRNGIDCKGYRIGNYTLIESTLDHVKIGCHVISWNVINNFFNV